ncbi:hypothetical protein BKA65DRAFT_1706 [Rhexocercosporidium sp. MPI-PUGE-AT-0058]|nr:hypothetical protein BKA65DRAFT_1706 [Rhexocercosporidium sp. MPI-PUGE-AT-0058]
MSKVRPSCPCQLFALCPPHNVTGCKERLLLPLLLAGPSQTSTQLFSFLLALALALTPAGQTFPFALSVCRSGCLSACQLSVALALCLPAYLSLLRSLLHVTITVTVNAKVNLPNTTR